MNGKYCYFHPESNADSFCEICGKFLCDECKQNFHFRYTSRNPSGGEIVIPKILCKDCYDVELNHRKKAKLWYIIILASIVVISGTITWIWIQFF